MAHKNSLAREVVQRQVKLYVVYHCSNRPGFIMSMSKIPVLAIRVASMGDESQPKALS